MCPLRDQGGRPSRTVALPASVRFDGPYALPCRDLASEHRAAGAGELYAFNLSEGHCSSASSIPTTTVGRSPPEDARCPEATSPTSKCSSQTPNLPRRRSAGSSASTRTFAFRLKSLTIGSPDRLEKALPIPAITTTTTGNQDDVETVLRICRTFGRVARQLTRRRDNRPTLQVADEYDVQDLLHAMLHTTFDDVRDETWQPHYLGRSTRIDFRLPESGIVVEAKFARVGHVDRHIGDELAEAVVRYGSANAAHAASTLICFIYDPQHVIVNPRGLALDLAVASTDRLNVVGIVEPS